MEKNDSVDVSIVIVTMNHLNKVKNLLASIDKFENVNFTYEIIVVDNCSKDGTIEFIKNNYSNINLNINTKIYGFAYNNNKGAKLTKGKYIFICNPDIVILKNSLGKLLEFAKQNKETGVFCPQLLNTDLTYQPSIRSFHSLKIIFSRLISRGNDKTENKVVNAYLLKDFDKNSIQKVDWALGAAMLLRKEFYEQLKGFDENFFLYVEDEDLCLRSWKLNRSVVYYPEAKMVHDHQRGSSKINILTWYHFKSFIYFIYKHNLFFKKVTRDSF